MKIKIVAAEESNAIAKSWRLNNGVIIWNRPANGGKKVGDPVGFSTRKSGHRNVFLSIGGKLRGFVYARVVWFLHYGFWPKEEIDHIDCDPQNDRIENLRPANRYENTQNTRWGRTGKKCKGTWQNKSNGKWSCQVQAFGKVYGEYGFLTEEDAYAARQKLATKLHGEFAR